MAYDPATIEEKIQSLWREKNAGRVHEDPSREKFYSLEMFIYPSGRIHMGHVRNYTIGDVIARFQRMRGRNVLHPMGFDAFGLPAENAAIKGDMHPREWTNANIASMKKQMKRLGLLYDWDREVRTCEPDYYRWNQWFFLKMHEKGLAYKATRSVNWCPDCSTVLANEQVEDGMCWRCHSQVTVKEMDQWFLRITDYAQELLDELDNLKDWPNEVVAMQKNWIGRSAGAFVDFPIDGTDKKIQVFTTRLDTIYGSTYLVLAPEHHLVDELTADAKRDDVEAFRASVRAKSTHERATSREKEGVFIGRYAVNPFSGEKIPVYIANFVLMDYGTGSIMSVPAHDQRDFEFAKKYDLPIRVVVQSGDLKAEDLKEAVPADGKMQESGPFNGLDNREAMEKMAAFAEEKGFAERTVTFRIRDWGISRQRYWGTPIPIVYCDRCGTVPVPEEELPVLLPETKDFRGEGGSPLARIDSFVSTTCPECGGSARRDTDTMDTFFDSSWYFLRYCNPRLESAALDREAVKYWLPVNFYIGGIEHATMHLIYFRFFTKVLRDMGILDFDEPVKRLMCQGMVIKDGSKMSKSIGNLVDPDAMIEKYGADAVRLNILFLAPPWDQLDWKESGADGAFRFLHKVYSLVEEFTDDLKEECREPEGGDVHPLRRKTHQTVARLTSELEDRLKLNTAIAGLMELSNEVQSFLKDYSHTPEQRFILREAITSLVSMLSPFCPHIADKMWMQLGNECLLLDESWPSFDREIAKEDVVTMAVQVNGKVRGQVTVPAGTSKDSVLDEARKLEKVRTHLDGLKIIKEIVVPGRIVNFVAK